MTREQYLNLRKANSSDILYEFYKEKYDSNKHNKFLSPHEFGTFFSMYANVNVNKAFERACEYFDNKFTIVQLSDKEGRLIHLL
jgi:hypothetical protein